MSGGSCLLENKSTVHPPKIDWGETGSLKHVNDVNDGFATSGLDFDSISMRESEESKNVEFQKILKERDEMWRHNERAHLNFVQIEHSNMLMKLHSEIENLQNQCFEISQKSSENVQSVDESLSKKIIHDLREQLASAHSQLATVKADNRSKDETLTDLTRRLHDAQISIAKLQSEANAPKPLVAVKEVCVQAEIEKKPPLQVAVVPKSHHIPPENRQATKPKPVATVSAKASTTTTVKNTAAHQPTTTRPSAAVRPLSVKTPAVVGSSSSRPTSAVNFSSSNAHHQNPSNNQTTSARSAAPKTVKKEGSAGHVTKDVTKPKPK